MKPSTRWNSRCGARSVVRRSQPFMSSGCCEARSTSHQPCRARAMSSSAPLARRCSRPLSEGCEGRSIPARIHYAYDTGDSPMRKLAILALCLFAGGGLARAEKPRVFAITGARLVIAPGQIIDGGTIVLRDGLIEAVGKGIAPPSDAWILDGSGKTVTAGFIDACTDLAQKKSEPPSVGAAQGPAPQRDPPAGPVHPISRIHAER